MEEKKKKEMNSGLLIIVIILVAIVSSIASIVIYRQILNVKGEEHLVNSLKQDMENLQTENNDVKDNNSDNYVIDSTAVEEIINGQKAKIEMVASVIENQQQDGDKVFFAENIDITINGNKVESLTTYAWTNKDNYEYIFPEVKKIKDVSNDSEYILLVSSPESITGNATNSFIIYDYNGNKIADISDYAGTSYTLIDSEYSIPAHTIREDSIEIIEPDSTSSGAEIYSYTIENGTMKKDLVKSYTSEEIQSAGKI